MSSTLLKLQNITVGYQEKNILENISATISESGIIALMGVNGIGKSCLLKSISGLIPLKAGNILITDRLAHDFTVKEFAQTIAIVLTDKIQVDFLTVSELVSLGRSPYSNTRGVLSDQDNNFVKNILILMNIFELKDSYLQDLSDGQKQKVSIARALAQNPKVLLLDEPTTYLDIPSKIDLMNMLKKISLERGLAILLSSHDADLASEYADQIWHIDTFGLLVEESPSNAKKIFIKSERE